MWKIDDFIKFLPSRDTYCTLKGPKGRVGSENSKRVHSDVYGTLISCERLSNPCFGNRINAKPRKFLSHDTEKYELCFWEAFDSEKKIFFVEKQSLRLLFLPKLKIFQMINFDTLPNLLATRKNILTRGLISGF